MPRNPLNALPADIRSSCVLGLVFSQGTYRDWSSYSHTVTTTGCWWSRENQKASLNFSGPDLLTVPDDSSLQLTEGTLFVGGDFDRITDEEALISTRDPGGANYALSLWSDTRVALRDSSLGAAIATINWKGARSIACVFVDGETGSAYADGVYGDVFSAVRSFSGYGANINIGSLYTGSDPLTNPLNSVLIFNRVLTASEIATVHQWAMNLRSPQKNWPGYGKGLISRPSRVPLRASGCVGAWDFLDLANGVVPDRSGNLNNGTVNGHVARVNTPVGSAGKFDGVSGYVDCGEVTVPTAGTVAMTFIPRDISGQGHLLSALYSGNGDQINVLWVNDGIRAFYYDGATTYASSETSVLKLGVPVRLVFTWDGSSGQTYINSVAATGSDGASVTPGARLVIGARNDYGNKSHTEILDVRLLDVEWTEDQVKADYKKFQNLVTYQSFPENWLVSLAEEGGSVNTRISNTDWLTSDTVGRFKVIDDDTHGKAIECTTAGVLTRPEVTGRGGSLAIRRDSSEWTYLRDSAPITTLNLEVGDKIALEHNTIEPVYQEDGYFSWTTDDTTQDWPVVRVDSGIGYWINWGDGTVVSFTGTGGNQNLTHNYASAGTYTVTFSIDDPTALELFYVYDNSLTGSIPSLDNVPNLVDFRVHYNSLSGSIPSLNSNTALERFYAQGNSLSGSIPSLNSNTALKYFYAQGNSLSGSIPSLNSNTALEVFRVHGNSLSEYTASTLSTTLTEFRVDDNALTQAAVDQILSDFTMNAAARPAGGTINLSGGTNAAPTPAVLSAANAALPTWTITTN